MGRMQEKFSLNDIIRDILNMHKSPFVEGHLYVELALIQGDVIEVCRLVQGLTKIGFMLHHDLSLSFMKLYNQGLVLLVPIL